MNNSIDLKLLKEYIVAQFTLGIKSDELQQYVNELSDKTGSLLAAYEILADEIIDSSSDKLEEFYNKLFISSNFNTDSPYQILARFLADFNTKQIEFLLSEDAPINILCGSVRSGKTWVACFKFGLRVILSNKDKRFMMVGHTLKSLESNTFKYFRDFFGKENFKYSINKKEAVLFGHKIRLEGAPNNRASEKITGDTLAGALVDEIQTIDKGFILQLYARCSDGNGFIYGTCNPREKSFWLNKEWITNPNMHGMVRTWTFLVSDNKFLPKKYIESLKYLFQGVFYQRNVLGMWVAAEGSCFPQFANNHEKYIIQAITKEQIQKINNEIHFATIGVDIGGNKSASTIVFTGHCSKITDGLIVLKSDKLKDDKGTIDVVTLNAFIVKNIKEFKEKYNIPIYSLDVDNAEQYIETDIRNEMMRQNIQLRVQDSKKLKVMDRVKFISKLLALENIRIIKDDAQTVIDSLDELIYDDKASEDRLLDDGSVDVDTFDGFSYSFTRYMNRYSYI